MYLTMEVYYTSRQVFELCNLTYTVNSPEFIEQREQFVQ